MSIQTLGIFILRIKLVVNSIYPTNQPINTIYIIHKSIINLPINTIYIIDHQSSIGPYRTFPSIEISKENSRSQLSISILADIKISIYRCKASDSAVRLQRLVWLRGNILLYEIPLSALSTVPKGRQ
ncbi:hypothetical protein CEXT_157251 [Caerostris extrusa]|uniref:Uncharacterized protein n=1 Tax=Caerostris extrusa TaxID=172846 RepID=A0AAV4ND70_CAEEX|nr:hypothetical protein CEXT_157251 [Caerostris extrusa]